MKVTGTELIEFVAVAWPQPEDDWYWEHEVFEDPDPAAVYDTDEIGGVFYQGTGEDPTNMNGYDLGKLIRKWRKERDFDLFYVEVPKEKRDAVIAAIKSAGGKVRA